MEHPDKQLLALAGMITGHASVLSPEVVSYYLSHRDQIPAALNRGFTLPTMPQQPQMPPPPTHDAVYRHLFGPIGEAIGRCTRGNNHLNPFECETYVNIPEPSGFVRQVYVPPRSSIDELMDRLKSVLSSDSSCVLRCEKMLHGNELPHSMMRSGGWFMVDFGVKPKSTGYEVIRDKGDYVAGLVALAGYVMYPKLAMYAGRDYKGLTVPMQVIPGIRFGSDSCLVIGQHSLNPVQPSPSIVSRDLDAMYSNVAFPEILWPAL